MKGRVIVRAFRKERLFKMEFRQESEKYLINVSMKKWHERFAHQYIKYVRNILYHHKYVGVESFSFPLFQIYNCLKNIQDTIY